MASWIPTSISANALSVLPCNKNHRIVTQNSLGNQAIQSEEAPGILYWGSLSFLWRKASLSAILTMSSTVQMNLKQCPKGLPLSFPLRINKIKGAFSYDSRLQDSDGSRTVINFLCPMDKSGPSDAQRGGAFLLFRCELLYSRDSTGGRELWLGRAAPWVWRRDGARRGGGAFVCFPPLAHLLAICHDIYNCPGPYVITG